MPAIIHNYQVCTRTHESIEITHIYLEADLATKERALNKLAPAGVEVPRFKAKDEALAFLATL